MSPVAAIGGQAKEKEREISVCVKKNQSNEIAVDELQAWRIGRPLGFLSVLFS
jgi:hypothetical protein